jgi:hypothetical protein
MNINGLMECDAAKFWYIGTNGLEESAASIFKVQNTIFHSIHHIQEDSNFEFGTRCISCTLVYCSFYTSITFLDIIHRPVFI